jgi:hypothetical protein
MTCPLSRAFSEHWGELSKFVARVRKVLFTDNFLCLGVEISEKDSNSEVFLVKFYF